MALAASASLNTLRASRSAGVITFRSNVSLILSLDPYVRTLPLRINCSATSFSSEPAASAAEPTANQS
jgi:hypothetical protein